MSIALRVLAVAGGLISIYAALFLYENEQGKVQSVLEDLWLRIEERKQAFLSVQASFMREVARFTNSGFDRLFGNKLFSWRAFAVSSCYSIASVCFVLAYHIGSFERRLSLEPPRQAPPHTIVSNINQSYVAEYGHLLLPFLAATTIGLLILGTLPAFIRRASLLKVWSVTVIILDLAVAGSLFRWEYYGWVRFFSNIGVIGSGVHQSLLWENLLFEVTPQLLSRVDFIGTMLVAFMAGISVGMICDITFIAITRSLLRWASQLQSFVRIGAVVVLNCILALVLSLGPGILGYFAPWLIVGQMRLPGGYAFHGDPGPPVTSLALFAEGLRQLGWIASLSNIITAFAALAFVVLAGTVLLHKLFWPVLERPIYALQRFGIARRSKLLGTVGLLLIGIGFGVAPTWLKEILDKFS